MPSSYGIKIVNHNDGLKQLVKFAIQKKLIPIFGSGMTAKSTTGSNMKVPNADSATELMKNIILDKDKQLSSYDISEWDFNKTSGYFYDNINIEVRDDFFNKYFIGVIVRDYRANIFRIEWPHAYTLNIDDGIENSSKFNVVVPYREIKTNRFRNLYKLHGDAYTEVTYEDNNIVFSANQYIRAISDDKNKSIYNALVRDFTQRNIFFCGCSLKNEPDIKFFVSSIKNNLTDGNARILLMDHDPKKSEIIDLKEYGINQIIVIDDYRIFFESLYFEIKSNAISEDIRHFKYKNPQIKEDQSREFALNFISKNAIFEKENNAFLISSVQVQRRCISKIEEQLKNNNSVIVKGRRFSGKTILLSQIASMYKRYTIYYFPSDIMVDSDFVISIFEKENDTLFLFDSNTLSGDSYLAITHASTLIKSNNNKVIIVVNSTDNYMLTKLNSGYVEIDSSFNNEEIAIFNSAIDNFGIIRRKNNDTHIDFAIKISNEYNLKYSNFDFKNIKTTFNEKIIIILLAALDKVYYADIASLGILFSEINNLINVFNGVIIECVTEEEERERDSEKKLVHNSKVILLDILNSFDDEEIINCIQKIVKSFKGDVNRERIYIDVILFDTINQLFPKKGYGSGRFIPKLYDHLEDYLSGSPHYWLQRAKSHYRMFYHELNKIELSLDWIKKSYNDGDDDLKPKAALSMSIIYGLLYTLDEIGDKKRKYAEKLIERSYESITSQYFSNNKIQFKNEILPKFHIKTGLQMIYSVCREYMQGSNISKNLSEKAYFVCKNLDNL